MYFEIHSVQQIQFTSELPQSKVTETTVEQSPIITAQVKGQFLVVCGFQMLEETTSKQ